MRPVIQYPMLRLWVWAFILLLGHSAPAAASMSFWIGDLSPLLFDMHSASDIVRVKPFKNSYVLPGERYQNSRLHMRLAVHPVSDPSGRMLTFGHVFPKGFLADINHLAARIEGIENDIPVQIDRKTFWNDHSVQHGIVTLHIPDGLRSAAEYDLEFYIIDQYPPASSQLDFRHLLKRTDYDLDIEIRLDAQDYHIDMATLLRERLFVEQYPQLWLDGHLVKEIRLSKSIGRKMSLILDIRFYANGDIFTDIQLAYDWLHRTPMRNVRYDLVIRKDGKTVFKDIDREQNHHSRWHYGLWVHGKASGVYPVFDTQIMRDMAAIPSYDLSLGGDKATIEGSYRRNRSFKPVGTQEIGFLKSDMTNIGEGDPVLGLLPWWSVQYLMSMVPQAADVMFTQADIAGNIPWHFRDEKTETVPLAKDHPTLWLDPHASLEKNGVRPYKTNMTNWHPDQQHQSSLSYIPYLISGLHFYLDNLKAQHQWNIMTMDPDKARPRNPRSLTRPEISQPVLDWVQSYAWNTRTMSNLAWVIPADDPFQPVVKQQLETALKYYTNMFMNGGFTPQLQGEAFGYLDGYTIDNVNRVFMQDLAAMVFSHVADRGYRKARLLARWQVNFIAGRFVQPKAVFDPRYATAGSLMTWDINSPDSIRTQSRPKKYLQSWQEIFQYSKMNRNFLEVQKVIEEGQDVIAGNPGLADSFATMARAANTSLFNLSSDPRSLMALNFLLPYMGNMEAAFRANPVFALTMQFRDGSWLPIRHIISADMFGRKRMPVGNIFVMSGAGNDFLSIPQGNGVLSANQGNDTLYGGEEAVLRQLLSYDRNEPVQKKMDDLRRQIYTLQEQMHKFLSKDGQLQKKEHKQKQEFRTKMQELRGKMTLMQDLKDQLVVRKAYRKTMQEIDKNSCDPQHHRRYQHWLLGGKGEDKLYAGPGNDYMRGSEAGEEEADEFIFFTRCMGDNVIADFQPNFDKIRFVSIIVPGYDGGRKTESGSPIAGYAHYVDDYRRWGRILKDEQGNPEQSRGLLQYLSVDQNQDVRILLLHQVDKTECEQVKTQKRTPYKQEGTCLKSLGSIQLEGIKRGDIKVSDFIFDAPLYDDRGYKDNLMQFQGNVLDQDEY